MRLNYSRFLTLLLISCFPLCGTLAQAQVCIRIPDQSLDIRVAKAIKGKVWLLTSQGAYRVDGTSATRIPDISLVAHSIDVIDEQIWLATSKGAYRIEDDKATRIPDIELDVTRVTGYAGAIWLEGSRGAYRIIGNDIRRVPDEDLTILRIEEAGGKIWLATDKGAFIVDGDTVTSLLTPKHIVFTVVKAEDQVWLLTNQGAYRVDGQTPVRLPDSELSVFSIKKIKGQTWLATDNGAYRVEGDRAHLMSEAGVSVRQIKNIKGKLWLATSKGVYWINGDKAFPALNIDRNIKSIQTFGDEVWLATDGGAYRVQGDSSRRVPDLSLDVSHIESVNGDIWIASDKGAYQVKGDVAKRTPDAEIRVNDVNGVEGKPWLLTRDGAYMVDDDIEISIESLRGDSLWKKIIQTVTRHSFLISGEVTPKIVYRSRTYGTAVYKEEIDPRFFVIMERDHQRFTQAVKNQEYVSAERLKFAVNDGEYKIYASIRDGWKNTFTQELTGWAVPNWTTFAIFIPFLPFVLLAVLIGLAPFSIKCNGLLMHPNMRKITSIGFFSVLMTTFPFIRRHIFRRYFNGVIGEPGFSIWQDRYVIPSDNFLPENLGASLLQHRRLYLIGPSGIGKTCYLRFLTGYYARRSGKNLQPKGVVPVFVPLNRYRGVAIEQVIHSQLEKFGSLSDEELAGLCLKQGGFLYLIDGLSDVDQETRDKVNTFVDQNSVNNYFCVSSQEYYPEFDGFYRISLVGLNSDKIIEMLGQRLGKVRAAQLIASFDESMFQLYELPQDLELAIELVKRGKPLPRSKQELYEASMGPILAHWEQNGHTDYPYLLFKRAYEMLQNKEAYFDNKDQALPEEIKNSLIEDKLLVRRAPNYFFRHDLVRSYLASRHFIVEWKKLTASDSAQIDITWTPMLEFTLPRMKSTEIYELLTVLLKKNLTVAEKIFKWLHSKHPELTEEWSGSFEQQYGKERLEMNNSNPSAPRSK